MSSLSGSLGVLDTPDRRAQGDGTTATSLGTGAGGESASKSKASSSTRLAVSAEDRGDAQATS